MLSRNLVADRKVRDASSHQGWAQAFREPILYLLALINLSVLAGGYALTFWLPTIIKGFGVNDIVHIGLYSIAPYAVGWMAMVWCGRHSDRTLERRWHFALGAFAAAAGFGLITMTGGHFVLSMVALSVASAGLSAALPIFWAVPSALLPGRTAPVGLALISSLSQLGGLAAPWMIGIIKNATGSVNYGLYPIMAILVLGGILMLCGVPSGLLRERREDVVGSLNSLEE
jgi:MFS family permease